MTPSLSHPVPVTPILQVRGLMRYVTNKRWQWWATHWDAPIVLPLMSFETKQTTNYCQVAEANCSINDIKGNAEFCGPISME